MSAEVQVQRSVPLEELFMIGVTPVQQDRVMTPSRAKSAKGDKLKVSNQCKLSEGCLVWVFMTEGLVVRLCVDKVKCTVVSLLYASTFKIVQLCRYLYQIARVYKTVSTSPIFW